MPFDANGNYTSNTSGFSQPYQMGAGSLSSYSGGYNPMVTSLPTTQPYQFSQAGMSQPYQFGSQGNYMGYPSQPMSFANTGTAPVATAPAAASAAAPTPQTDEGGFNPIGFGLGAIQTGV
jgi:hypothetical protein